MERDLKERVLTVFAGVIIGALVLYIVGLLWMYYYVWKPQQDSIRMQRQLDRYIKEHGYEYRASDGFDQSLNSVEQ